MGVSQVTVEMPNVFFVFAIKGAKELQRAAATLTKMTRAQG
jgi:hypothetical protein